MKHLFETQEELQVAHESLAFVEYLFANRQNTSQFICINLLSLRMGEHDETPLDWDAHQLRSDVCKKLEKVVCAEIAPYSTVETVIVNRDNLMWSDQVDAEMAREFRLAILAKLLKELA